MIGWWIVKQRIKKHRNFEKVRRDGKNGGNNLVEYCV
jgi:hypothetical protein